LGKTTSIYGQLGYIWTARNKDKTKKTPSPEPPPLSPSWQIGTIHWVQPRIFSKK